MMKPRNSFVVVKLLGATERKVGAISVSTANELFTEGTVMAVGEGSVDAAGGRPSTHDLREGQRVYVKHKQRTGGGPLDTQPTGVKFTDGEVEYTLFEQMHIIGIIAEPGQTPGPLN